jgi:protein gp37/ParB-like chromosome segregation protein Spo0J
MTQGVLAMLEATRWPIERLRPHPKNREIYGDTADDELVRSVREHGVLTPITVTAKGVVVSGHRRLVAARAAGLREVPVTPLGSDDELDVLQALIESNRQRNKSNEQLGREAMELHGVLAERNRRGRPDKGSKNSRDIARIAPRDRRTDAQVAKKLGVGQKRAEEARRVVTAIDQLATNGKTQESERLRQTLNGRSVHRAYTDAERNGYIAPQAKPEKVADLEPPAPPLILLGEDPSIPRLITLPVWKGLTEDQRQQVLTRPRSKNASFNWQVNDDIEWARWSWNPVTGCLHNCSYCYAREIAERSDAYPQKFVPTFLPERLSAPLNTRYPSPEDIRREPARQNVFTCSMADLFGRWVPDAWIEAVMQAVRSNPQWNYLFLTKFPQRLPGFDFPDNAWIGTTIDAQVRIPSAEQAFERVNAKVKWLSCEPMLENLRFSRLDLFDWVVIGGASANAESGTPAFRPPRQWVNDLWAQARDAGCLIYEKTNLLERTREMPGVKGTPVVDVKGAFKMQYLQRDVLDNKTYAKEMAR